MVRKAPVRRVARKVSMSPTQHKLVSALLRLGKRHDLIYKKNGEARAVSVLKKALGEGVHRSMHKKRGSMHKKRGSRM